MTIYSKTNNSIKLRALLNAALLAYCACLYPQHNLVLFRQGSAEIDSVRYGHDLDSVAQILNEWMKPPYLLRGITINAYASPDGSKTLNKNLALRRAENLKLWLSRHTSVPDSLLRIGVCQVDWATLEAFVRADNAVPARDQSIEVITLVPEETRTKGKGLTDSRLHRLKMVNGGKSYRYLSAKYFSSLRYGEIIGDVTIYDTARVNAIRYREENKPSEDSITTVIPGNAPQVAVQNSLPAETPDTAQAGTSVIPATETYDFIHRPLFALKTNLLYDIALTPNIEVEIPIGKRWSINGEFLHGWWLGHDDTFCWQLEALGMEGRYWLGNRTNRRVLTGWFLGFFAGAGVYDFQLKKDKGYQGDFYISAGFSAGYAMQFGSSSWGMEFSASAGWLTTDYTRYTLNPYVRHELIRDGADMRFSGVVPLKAKVSLIYLFSRKAKVKGGAR
ncbi:MAG: DUF3575 domain-containing protein [Prevotella sp.]|jgi:hypothetical protein|nr:DUF3575 domain-containing protein [Prevotella sp.]